MNLAKSKTLAKSRLAALTLIVGVAFLINIGNKMTGISGVYWVGQDGNTYIKTNTSGGVKNVGYAGVTNPNMDVLNGLTQIADPVAPNSTVGIGQDSANPTALAGYNSTPQVDHTYDAWGGRAGYDQANAQIDSGLNTIRSNGANSFTNSANDIRSGLQSSVWDYQDKQNQINNNRANNELNRLGGIQDILGYVRTGLRQGGARLAAANATDSSATGALQRAYQQLGAGKTRSLNNQAGLKSVEQDQAQQQLLTNIDRSKQTLVTTRTNAANKIGTEVQNALQQLDQQAIGMSLPGKIAVDQEKQNIVNNGISQLQALDSWFSDQLNTLHQATPEETAAKARELQSAGTALTNPFTQQFDSQEYIQGAPVDQLPLFTRSRKVTG